MKSKTSSTPELAPPTEVDTIQTLILARTGMNSNDPRVRGAAETVWSYMMPYLRNKKVALTPTAQQYYETLLSGVDK
jgi:hypothetical protein